MIIRSETGTGTGTGVNTRVSIGIDIGTDIGETIQYVAVLLPCQPKGQHMPNHGITGVMDLVTGGTGEEINEYKSRLLRNRTS